MAARQGRLVAAVLAGAWRDVPPRLTLSTATLDEITPILLKSATAGLVWRRLEGSDSHVSNSPHRLREAYRYEVLQAALREHQIIQALELLRSVGVEPLLAKGWAVARRYPGRGLRPYGDIDLYVRPDQHLVAMAALADHGARTGAVDLHKGVTTLDDRSVDELYDRSHIVRLGEVNVRVFAAEDQLRHLCLHLWRHGASRPLWLCDIGVVLESVPAAFDWERVFRGSPRRAQWVACALELAHRLFGARLDNVPAGRLVADLPGWLVPAVFRQWQIGRGHIGTVPAATLLRRPTSLLRGLRLRWPHPIQATVNLGGAVNDLPRLPFQLGECVTRTARFLVRRDYLKQR